MDMMRADSIVAGILVGGKSRRMGSDKQSLPWDGSTMLETIVSTVMQVTPRVVLLGGSQRIPDAARNLPCLPDTYADAGPLGGLASLLHYAPHAWSMLLCCDIPRVSVATLSALLDQLPRIQDRSDATQCVVYGDGSRFEPTCALYHAHCLPQIEQSVAANSYGLHALIRNIPHLCVTPSEEVSASLRNINTPEDYRTQSG